MSSRHQAIVLPCHYGIRHQSIMLPCDYVIMTPNHYVTISLCHLVIQSIKLPCHYDGITTPIHYVTMSLCHHDSRSSFHNVILCVISQELVYHVHQDMELAKPDDVLWYIKQDEIGMLPEV